MNVPPETPSAVVVAASRAIAQIPGLGPLLDAQVVRTVPAAGPGSARAVLARGRKPSSIKAQALATRLGLPLVRLEDGFLRSLRMAPDDPPLSLVEDDLGIYYDASAPSRLESLIAAAHSGEQRSRASRLITAWRSGRVSKYNHARELPREEQGPGGHANDGALHADRGMPAHYVLAADQTRGDASIRFGRADAASFQRMLEAALEEHPDSTVLLKVHPENRFQSRAPTAR